ncbi:MAG: hypothetical protein LBM69_10795 [Lachnospiraceae bacterium]|jgi:hypothetical protein|nr:hypothetical protein [Lachnospiraceae bacterium]
MKKISVLPKAENNLVVTIIATILFVAGIFGIIALVVYYFATHQLLGAYVPYAFYGSMLVATVIWRVVLGLLARLFSRSTK